jgi:hypothetical protein
MAGTDPRVKCFVPQGVVKGSTHYGIYREGFLEATAPESCGLSST